jgi:PAS domain S-box-containing protein
MVDRGVTQPVEDAAWRGAVERCQPGLQWSTDLDLRLVACHGRLRAAMAAREGDLRGRTLFEIFETSREDFPLIAAHRGALRGDSCPVEFTLAGVPLCGHVAPLRLGSEITGCTMVALDQTLARARCDSIAQTAVDFILFLKPDGTIAEVNRIGGGHSREGVLGRSIFHYTPAESHLALRHALASAYETGETVTLEIRFLGRLKQPRWHSMRIGPVCRGGEATELVLLVTDITEHQEVLQRLRAEEGLLRDLLELQDRERRMVAYEIHDGFIQDVVGSRMILEGMRTALLRRDDTLRQRLDSAVSLLARAINDGRRLISELRPMIIDEMGIIDAVEYLIGEEESVGEFEVEFTHRLQTDRLPPLLQATIFRIVRESLNNARRHSEATRVEIRMTQIADQFIIVEIQDNGTGFDPDSVPRDRYGLSGICERAKLFGGGATIESAPHAGTRITVKLAMEIPCVPRESGRPKWTWTI